MFSEVAQPYNTLDQQLYAGYCPCERKRSEPWDDDYYDMFDYYGGSTRKKRKSKRRKVRKLSRKKLLRLMRKRR